MQTITTSSPTPTTVLNNTNNSIIIIIITQQLQLQNQHHHYQESTNHKRKEERREEVARAGWLREEGRERGCLGVLPRGARPGKVASVRVWSREKKEMKERESWVVAGGEGRGRRVRCLVVEEELEGDDSARVGDGGDGVERGVGLARVYEHDREMERVQEEVRQRELWVVARMRTRKERAGWRAEVGGCCCSEEGSGWWREYRGEGGSAVEEGREEQGSVLGRIGWNEGGEDAMVVEEMGSAS